MKAVALTLPQGNISIPSGFIHKLTDSGSPVKNKFINTNKVENYNFSLNDDDEFGRLVDSLDDDGRTEVNSRNRFDEMFSGDNDYLGSDEFGGPRFSIATGYKNRDKLKETAQKYEKVAEEFKHKGFSQIDVFYDGLEFVYWQSSIA